jgi:hypothetical protein
MATLLCDKTGVRVAVACHRFVGTCLHPIDLLAVCQYFFMQIGERNPSWERVRKAGASGQAWAFATVQWGIVHSVVYRVVMRYDCACSHQARPI